MKPEIKKAAKEMAQAIVKKFPDVKIHGIQPSLNDPSGACLSIQFPKNENREWEVRRFAAQVSNKILETRHVFILPISGSMPNGHH